MNEFKNRFRLFIKFLSSEYLNSFLKEGLVYMNPIKYYIDLEEKEYIGRKDKNEGLLAPYLANKVKIEFNHIELKRLTGRVDIRDDDELFSNIYCLTGINDYHIFNSNKKLSLSKKFTKMGDKAVVIFGEKISEFIKRLKSAIEKNKSIYKNAVAKPVEYVDYNTYHGEMGIFKKYSKFEWQFEWRLAIRKIKKGYLPVILKIGNLYDIATVYNTEDLIKLPIEMEIIKIKKQIIR